MKNIIILYLFSTVSVFAQNAALDPNFGNSGYSVHTDTSEITCFIFDSNENIISAGVNNQGTGGWHLNITKTNKNGILDTSFGTNGKVTTIIEQSAYPNDITVQPDGKIIVVGSLHLVSGGGAGFVVRYNSNGTLDQTFGTNGTYLLASANQFYSVLLLSNGSIMLGGNTNNINARGILVKLDTNGIIDTIFGTNGILPLDSMGFQFTLGKAVLLSDNKILCIGDENTDSTNQKAAYCKIDTQGNFDNLFGQNGKVVTDIYNNLPNTSESLRNVKELPNGAIILEGGILGQFYNSNILLKINANGSIDTTFGTNGVVNHLYPRIAFEVQPDGKIIIGGTKLLNSNDARYSITRFTASGVLDTSFNNGNGFVDINPSLGSDGLQYIKLQSNDSLIIGGSSKINSVSNFTLARILLDTPLSVNEPLEQFIKVYPNPVKDRLFIEDSEGIIKSIKIFNNTSKLIKTFSEPTESVHKIDTNFANGIYHIIIETKDGRTINKKIIKK